MKVTTLDVQRFGEPGGGDFEILVVQLVTDTGLTGFGYQMLFGSTGLAATNIIRERLAPRVVGETPWATSTIWQQLYDSMPRRGSEGMVRGSIAAIDMALWDLKAKHAGVPVYQLFGGRRTSIPTYANCAHHLPADELAVKAAQYVSSGHRALKIRGNRLFVTTAEATKRVAAVREAVGPDVRLMVDVNGTWDVDTAIQQLKRWERYDIYWLEEPVPPQDIAGYCRVRAKAGSTYIAGGEQHVGLAEFKALIDNNAVDILQPNVAVTGGITDWLKVHAYATAHSVPISPWNMQGVHLHMAAGLDNVQWIEYFMPDNPLLALKARLFSDAGIDEEVRDDGVYLSAPEAPGLGIALNDDVANECRISA